MLLALMTIISQKSESTIEGAVEQLTLRLDNNSIFTGKKLEAKTIQVATESYSKAIIFASNTITIDATGKSEIQLFGDQKIEIKRFTDNAVLMKKSLK